MLPASPGHDFSACWTGSASSSLQNLHWQSVLPQLQEISAILIRRLLTCCDLKCLSLPLALLLLPMYKVMPHLG